MIDPASSAGWSLSFASTAHTRALIDRRIVSESPTPCTLSYFQEDSPMQKMSKEHMRTLVSVLLSGLFIGVGVSLSMSLVRV